MLESQLSDTRETRGLPLERLFDKYDPDKKQSGQI